NAQNRSAEIDARAYIDAANDELRSIGITLPHGEDYDTVGGLIVTRLGRIPEVGESITVGDTPIVILEAEPTRVLRVRIEARPAEAVEITPKPEEPEQVSR